MKSLQLKNKLKHYDYIIAGAGCAGLSLLIRMLRSGLAADKRILVIEKEPKLKNDRTWCFWETGHGLFESVVSQRWRRLQVHSPEASTLLNIHPYEYKMIRGIDFYNHCFAEIAKHAQVDVRYGNAHAIRSGHERAVVELDREHYSADHVFSSLPETTAPQPGKHYLLQHFSGWVIETTQPVFDTSVATIMDFRTPQAEGLNFIYLLPLSPTRALAECTFFSDSLLQPEVYQSKLRSYLQTHFPGLQYAIVENEEGIIPMSNHNYPRQNGRIVYLGTAAGQTRPSTGYTFQFIQEHTAQLVQSLLTKGHPYHISKPQPRHQFYDAVFLNVLGNPKVNSVEIFDRMFRRNHAAHVLRFLDSKSSLKEELILLASLPKRPFVAAAIKELRTALFPKQTSR